MVMPFGLYYSDLERLSSDELARLAKLLGVEPGVGLDGVRRAMASVNRLWSRRCMRLGLVRTVLFPISIAWSLVTISVDHFWLLLVERLFVIIVVAGLGN